MRDIDRLKQLLENRTDEKDLQKWLIGKIPKHFKRCNVDEKERLRLALLGIKKLMAFYDDGKFIPFFCQSLIAGAILSGDYDTLVIVTPSRYGKSMTLGHTALVKAYNGRDTAIAGATTKLATKIMQEVHKAVAEMRPSLQLELANGERTKIERLLTSLSKTKISFPKKGSVNLYTLGDTYDSQARNDFMGDSMDAFVDEAAFVGQDSMQELGRRDFDNLDETRNQLVMISNPHSTGYFYDALTEEKPREGTFILWIDALTTLEEGRTTYKQIMESDFAQHRSTLRRYLLCELDEDGNGMFDKPMIDDDEITGQRMYFMGVDSAYKGKDNIVITLSCLTQKGYLKVEEVAKVKKGEWIDGVTSQDIISDVMRVYRRFGVKFICVDVGWGVWLTEGLASRGANVLGVHFGEKATPSRVKANHYGAKNAERKRDELHLDLQDLIEHNKIRFTSQAYDTIRDVLPHITSTRKTNDKVKVVEKSEIKAKIGRSPDELDSVLLSIHAFIIYTGMDFRAIY